MSDTETKGYKQLSLSEQNAVWGLIEKYLGFVHAGMGNEQKGDWEMLMYDVMHLLYDSRQEREIELEDQIAVLEDKIVEIEMLAGGM